MQPRTALLKHLSLRPLSGQLKFCLSMRRYLYTLSQFFFHGKGFCLIQNRMIIQRIDLVTRIDMPFFIQLYIHGAFEYVNHTDSGFSASVRSGHGNRALKLRHIRRNHRKL